MHLILITLLAATSGAPAPEKTVEEFQAKFPQGTICKFELTREELERMKPGKLVIPYGKPILCVDASGYPEEREYDRP